MSAIGLSRNAKISESDAHKFMNAFFSRYFQLVKCFRDEDLRGNRQPEFTQIDMELAFTQPEEIFRIVDGLLAGLFAEIRGVEVKLPIPRMTYGQAMEEYGSDAPDLRFGLKLVDLTEVVRGSGFKVFAGAIRRRIFTGIERTGTGCCVSNRLRYNVCRRATLTGCVPCLE